MPFHSVNDSTIVEIAGIHTNMTWMAVGTPTMIQSVSLSRRVRLEKRRRLAFARAGGAGDDRRLAPRESRAPSPPAERGDIARRLVMR